MCFCYYNRISLEEENRKVERFFRGIVIKLYIVIEVMVIRINIMSENESDVWSLLGVVIVMFRGDILVLEFVLEKR